MTEVTTRGSIPSQAVNRRPLPERDFITLCELVTWRAIGKARSAAVLRRFVRRFIRRHKGQPWLTELRRVIENEAAHLLSLLRSREIEAFGHVDHGARRKIPREYLVNDVFAEPQSDTIAPDYSVRFDSDDVPTYRSVCFLRTDVQRTFGIAGNRAAGELSELGEAEHRPLDKHQRNRDVEADALLKNRINAVIAKAKAKWQDPESRPGINEMARELVTGQPGRKIEVYGEEAIRKILSGTYKPAKDRSIPGLSSG